MKSLKKQLIDVIISIGLALLYNLVGGIILSASSNWGQMNFGALYIDVIFFFLLLKMLRFMRRQNPAKAGVSSPLRVILNRIGILFLLIVFLLGPVFKLKVATGDYFTYVANSVIYLHITIASVIMLVYVGLDLGYELMDSWRKAEAEKEKLHRLHTQAQFENLKAQVNPHFLFNSLNTLSSLIVEDGDRARQFVRQLSTVYRYILENRENDLVELEREKSLFDSFVYLCQTRFEENFIVHAEWPENLNQWSIPPMTLQILVENAIKHNVISKQKPLTLWVNYDEGILSVGNTNQPRRQLDSGTGFGLKNIRERFHQLSDKEVSIINQDGNFVVQLPLIPRS